MAARYRKIDPRMWDDEKFLQLVPREKLVAVYCITGQSNRCGIFPFSAARGSEHTGVDPDSYTKAFRNVCAKLCWRYDEATRLLYIPTWWKYNPPENPKHLQGCLQDIHDIPTSPLVQEFKENITYLPEWGIPVLRGEISHSYARAMPYQEKKKKQKKKQDSESASHSLPASAAGDSGSPEALPNGPDGHTENPRTRNGHKRASNSTLRTEQPESGETGELGTDRITVDAIYRAYPRHEEPQAAKISITKALSRIRKRGTPDASNWLLERVTLYASARHSLELLDPSSTQFTPYPQKWFNKSRFDEDPATWNRDPKNGRRSEMPLEHAVKNDEP